MNADLFLHPLFLTEDIPSIPSSLSRSLSRYAIARSIHLLSGITLPRSLLRRILPQALGLYDCKILDTSNVRRGREDGVGRIQILSVVPALLSSELACVEIVSRRAEDLAPDLERLGRGDGGMQDGSCDIIFV
jgi:hypothetical protein